MIIMIQKSKLKQKDNISLLTPITHLSETLRKKAYFQFLYFGTTLTSKPLPKPTATVYYDFYILLCIEKRPNFTYGPLFYYKSDDSGEPLTPIS